MKRAGGMEGGNQAKEGRTLRRNGGKEGMERRRRRMASGSA